MLSILKNYFSFLGDRKKDVNKGIFWAIVNSIGTGMQLMAVYVVIDALINASMHTSTAWQAFIIMFISMMLQIISNKFGTMAEVTGSFYMCADKRNEIGDKLKYFPMGYFNDSSLGKITSTVTTTLDMVQDQGSRIVKNVIHGIIHGIIITIFMMAFDYRIGLIVLAGIVLFIIINTIMQKKAKVISPARHKAQVNIVDAILEYVQGIAVVRSYNLATKANQKLSDAISECEKNNVGLEIAFIPYMFLQSLCLKITSLLIMISSLYFTVNGSMDIAICIVMIISSMVIFGEIEKAGSMSSLMRLLEKSMNDVRDILNVDTMNNTSEERVKGNYDIEIKNASFSYGDKKIIDGISAKIPEGKLTAIIGPSGGGKTTLCNLMSRFWDVDEGEVILGGRNVKEYSLDYLFSNFSLVFQDVYLFNDTIANNIKFGKKDASMDEVIAASKKASCHDFVMKLPKGYDTIIGESGGSLSGGEKQRISIARAIIKDAPIIILDEATANVDPENEESLEKAVTELTKSKTVIMIAHRLKTVRNADQILVVEDGKITERGLHDALMNKNGTYANFVNMRKQSIGWKLGKNK